LSGLEVRGGGRGRGKEGVRVGKDTTIRLQTFLMTAAGAFYMEEHIK